MTAQILGKELESLIQESKRKHTEIKNAADKSLRDLRALPSTSEAQLAADLRRRPQFSSPFISACKTGTSKLILPAIVCLQRLVVSGGLSSERLQEVLGAFLECSKSNLDVQLRVLQSLPSILQNYSDALEGDLQAAVLQVCTTLQQVKHASVSSTASATLQQVVSSVFDKVETEDGKSESVPISAELNIEGSKVHIGSAAHDAYRVLDDLCLLIENQPARFIPGATITQSFGLELVEAILTNHGDIFDTHQELGYLLRTRVMSMVTRFLSERLSFAVTVRTTRIFCIVIREHLSVVQGECEIPLSLINHSLDSDGSNPWRRALCMETFRVIYSTPNLATEVYHLYDENPNKRNLVQENLAHFVRLAAEKPGLIGVGQQSSFPVGPNAARPSSPDQLVIETGSVAGLISGELGVSEVNAPGISAQWSSMKTPCLDILDKSEPPSIPDTYIYSLVLTCLNNLSEALAKIILPLTVHGRNKVELTAEEPADSSEDVSAHAPLPEEVNPDEKNSMGATDRSKGQGLPLNPLTLTNHPYHSTIKTIAHLIDECWPAMLATSSTFLYAALDADFYRGLIRSVQRITQVAGLLRLTTPRDAFFTTLAKSAIPPNLLKSDGLLSPAVSSPRIGSEGFFSEPITPKAHSRRGSFDSTSASLSQRNLMCLRALINLGIALGSTLDKSWSIIVESLQKADTILAQSGTSAAREYRSNSAGGDRAVNDAGSKQSGLNTEVSAVEAAVTRLLQATADFPSSAFMFVLRAFCDIAGNAADMPTSTSTPTASSGSFRMLRRTPSSTTLNSTAAPQNRSVHFAISKLGELARININRLAIDSASGAWELLSQKLRSVAASPFVDSTARFMAADVIGSVSLGITIDTTEDSAEIRQEVQLRSLASLELLVQALYENIRTTHEIAGAAEFDIHRAALEAVRSILENCGESLIAGWRSIFSILRSTFDSTVTATTEEDSDSMEQGSENQKTPRPISPKIARSAFACVQLICSDFLDSLKRTRIIILIDILCQFCSQSGDLNISLTTVTLFWNLSDFLQDQLDMSSEEGSSKVILDSTSKDDMLRAAAEEGSFEALWMILQSQLGSMTHDDRVDVRNGAIQTVYRILGNRGDQLSAKLWTFTFQRVILQMVEINFNSHKRNNMQEASAVNQNSGKLESTTDMLLGGLSTAISTHLEIVTSLPSFQQLWQVMMDHFSSFIGLGSDEICTSIFNFLTQVLGAAHTADAFGPTAVKQTMKLLEESMPSLENADSASASRKEKVLVSYVKTLKQIYKLIQDHIEPQQVSNIAANVQDCIRRSYAPAYTSDVDSMTTLQAEALECFEILRTDLPGVASAMIERLSELLIMPYSQPGAASANRGLTFVAFSKKATALLENIICAHHDTIEIYETGAVSRALKALCLAMSFKYRLEKQGRAPSMWQKSTTSSVMILPKILPGIQNAETGDLAHFGSWLTIAEMKSHIVNAAMDSLPVNETLVSDETFDLEASESLRQCLGININNTVQTLISPLNSINQGQNVATRYVQALFQGSLIHEVDFRLPAEPLRNLYKMRPGSTVNPEFNPRIRMCYQSLDELFALVTLGLNDHSQKQTPVGATTSKINGNVTEALNDTGDAPLPKAAFDYLILRCALPLRRYVADQPLRGKMPTPTSQRLELFYILRKMKELKCVAGSRAVEQYRTEREDNTSTFSVPVLKPGKRHLEWLLPLVHMASVHARRDVEIADALQDVVDAAFTA